MLSIKYKILLLIGFVVGIWLLQRQKERVREKMEKEALVRKALIRYKQQRDEEERKKRDEERKNNHDNTEWHMAMNSLAPPSMTSVLEPFGASQMMSNHPGQPMAYNA